MPARVTSTPAARNDLLEHFVYLGRQSEATAWKFLRAAGKTINLMADFPELGSPWETDDPQWQGVRFTNIHRFRNYLVFYRPVTDGILVLRVLHGSRDLPVALGE